MEGTIGEIRMFAGNFAPRSWAFCQGQLLAISSNTALFSIIGTTYGGDGRTTMGLPDLRGRTPIGTGSGPGLSPKQLGQKGGVEEVTLNQTQIPSHSHFATMTNATLSNASMTGQIHTSSSAATEDEGDGNNLGATTQALYTEANADQTLKSGSVSGTVTGTVTPGSITVANTGGNLSHTNMQPFLGMNYIICLFGIYPSRS